MACRMGAFSISPPSTAQVVRASTRDGSEESAISTGSKAAGNDAEARAAIASDSAL